MKKSDINTLMSEELKELHRLIEEILEISEPAFLEHATSAFSAALFDDLGSEYQQQAEKAHADFDCLCQAAPHVPRECLRSLSMAYGFFFDSSPENETEIDQVRTLMVVAHYKGRAIATLSEDERKKSADKAKEFERKALRSIKARKAANAVHDKPGGNREKQETVRAIWASGKYTSRDICAEQEAAGLNMSFSTARKALRNTPQPA